jgi:hypothetical protein
MAEHMIAVPVTDEEYIDLNVLYNAMTTLDLQHPNKRNKTRPEFYKELIKLGMEQLKAKETEKWEEALRKFRKQ